MSSGVAGNRLGVVDGTDLGHALAVALLPLREPGGELGCAPRRGLRGGGTQGVRTHDDALAVTGDDEHVCGLAGGPLALLIEGVEVRRRSLDQLLQLALAQALSGAPQNRLPDVVEGAARALHDGQSPQPVRVQLERQVQLRVGGMQLGVAPPPVSHACDLDLAENGQQPALVVSLHAASRNSVGSHHCFQAQLLLGAQVQVVLEHLAEQLAALYLQALLRFAVGELARLIRLAPSLFDPRHFRTNGARLGT